MKKLTSLLVLCAIFCTYSISSQSDINLQELLERKNKTTHKCVTAVFSNEEMAVLRAHFGHLTADLPQADMGGDEKVYGIENVTEVYSRFNSDDPSVATPISDSPITNPNFEGAGAINEDGTMAYVIDNNNNLYTLAFLTGVYTLLGVLNPPAGMSFTGLEFDPTDGTLFALATDAVSTVLMIINLVTIAAVLVGVTGMVLGIALAASPLGELFALDIDNDRLWGINKITAAAFIIGAIGFDANFAQGMALSVIAGVILLAAFNNGVFDSLLYTLNLVTGFATLIGVIIVGTLSQFGWIGIPNPNLGVGDQLNRLFEIFPNPAGDSVFLQSKDEIESVSIYDMMGRRVMYQPVDAMSSEVNLSYLASGQYVCTALVNGQTETYQIVKK